MRPPSAKLGLQLSAWLALTAIYFALDLGAQPDPNYVELAVRALVWGLCGWGISLLAWTLWRRLSLDESPGRLVMAAGLGGLGFGALWLLTFNLIDALVGLEPGYVPVRLWHPTQLLREGLTFVFPMIAWHGVAFSLREIERRADDRTRAAEAERLLERAKLDALRYQLNPHLLFNALNSVMAMIDEDPERAESMLQSVSSLMRGALQAPREGTLGEELERVRAYLELERVRFESRLDVAISVAPGLEATPLPTLLIQPLVENAVKHGMRRSPMPLRVRVRVAEDAGVLRVLVANSGPLGSSLDDLGDLDTGVGLANVSARVAAHYGDGGRVRLVEVERDGQAWVDAELCLRRRSLRPTLTGMRVSEAGAGATLPDGRSSETGGRTRTAGSHRAEDSTHASVRSSETGGRTRTAGSHRAEDSTHASVRSNSIEMDARTWAEDSTQAGLRAIQSPTRPATSTEAKTLTEVGAHPAQRAEGRA